MVRIVLSLVTCVVASPAALVAERLLWVSEAPGGEGFEVGGLAGTTRAPWLLTVPQAGNIVLADLRWSQASPPQALANSPAAAPGQILPWSPRAARLLRFPDGETLVFSVEALEVGSHGESRFAVFLRRASEPGGPWSVPGRVVPRAGHFVELGTPLVLRTGKVLLPLMWQEGERTTLGLYASSDSGVRWTELITLDGSELATPSLAEIEAGRLLLIASRHGDLVSCTSGDGGVTWSPWRGLGIAAAATGIALAPAGPGALALAWIDPPGDSTQAPPPLQALRLSFSTDGGGSWKPARELLLRPGGIPGWPALLVDAERLVVACADRVQPGSPGAGRIVCLGFERRELEPTPIVSAQARYGIAPDAARASLAVLCGHTLARPEEPRRLFVEGYFMRSLAVAADVLASHPGDTPEWFDAEACAELALAWADSLAARQDKAGYWPLGYGSVFIADIAAALGVFPALEARAGEERLQRWEAAARRFVTALEEDEMILPSGAFGIGWPNSAIPRVQRRVSRLPYLVSTALAGIELHAWLARRSGGRADRERALAALEWTLAQVQKDGALPRGPQLGGGREGAFVAAAYVQEGWMAADLLLGGREVRNRLRAVLPRHVGWLLRQQRPDGSWDSGADGEFARTPACVNFLVWYDRRIESRADVREAVRRAGLRLVDPQQWPATGLFATGMHHEVLRAHAGRVLAALAQEGPVR